MCSGPRRTKLLSLWRARAREKQHLLAPAAAVEADVQLHAGNGGGVSRAGVDPGERARGLCALGPLAGTDSAEREGRVRAAAGETALPGPTRRGEAAGGVDLVRGRLQRPRLR